MTISTATPADHLDAPDFPADDSYVPGSVPGLWRRLPVLRQPPPREEAGRLVLSRMRRSAYAAPAGDAYMSAAAGDPPAVFRAGLCHVDADALEDTGWDILWVAAGQGVSLAGLLLGGWLHQWHLKTTGETAENFCSLRDRALSRTLVQPAIDDLLVLTKDYSHD